MFTIISQLTAMNVSTTLRFTYSTSKGSIIVAFHFRERETKAPSNEISTGMEYYMLSHRKPVHPGNKYDY